MLILLQILLSSALGTAQTSTVITVHGNLAVYEKPLVGSEVMFYAVEGEKLRLIGPVKNGFRRVTTEADDGINEGFVRERDLRRSERLGPPLGRWGFGGGMMYTYLQQEREPFSTADDVTYKPSDYTSKGTAPLLAIQRRRDNFWRIILARKFINYTGTAKTDLAGSKDQDVKLELLFYSLAFEKAWNPWRKRPPYFGFNFEVAKAMSQKLTLNHVELATDKSVLPVYVGVQALAGASFFVHRRLSLYIEAKAGGVWNQSPVILQVEGAAGLLYWP